MFLGHRHLFRILEEVHLGTGLQNTVILTKASQFASGNKSSMNNPLLTAEPNVILPP
jgi:hypothetical protein